LSKHKKKKKKSGTGSVSSCQWPRHEVNDIHHIIPKARGGSRCSSNLVKVNWELHHNAYHKLFGNMKPDEICIYLTKNWWNGNVKHLKKALAKLC